MRGTYICAQATGGHLRQTSDDVYFRGDPPRVLHHGGGGVCCVATGVLMLIWLNRILRLCPGPLETLPQYDVKDDETRQAEYVEHVWRDAGHRGPSHTSGRIQVISRCSRPASDNRVLAFYAHLERSAASSSHYYYYFFFYNSPTKHAGVNLEMYSFANYLLEMSRVTSFCWGGKLITLSAYKKHWAAACTRRSELFLSDIIWKHRWLSTW